MELTKKEIKVRYKNSYLGYLWSIANPLMLAVIFYFVFKIVTKVQMENYTLFLISGLFVWQWIQNSITSSSNLYISNASLIKKVNFPRNFLVLSLVLSEGFNFVFSIPVILFFMFFYEQSPSIIWLYGVPILLIITGGFIYALSLLIATVNLFFRDMERLVGLLLMFIFYMTPILYPVSMVPEKYRILLYFDIFAPIVISWRDLLLNNFINIDYVVIGLVYSLSLVAVSSWIYGKLKYKFAELV